MSKKPLVSIVCITFNQVRFIKETLQGFIMQKANFEFEVLIHDDASTDGTRQIIEDYTKKYPEIIKPVYEENNQYSQGDYTFINDTFRRAKGVYVAFCEGDDFWTDPDKLQIQVDFLETNTSCALCFHPVRVFFEGNDQPESTYPSDMAEADFTLNELLRRNYIQSNSVLYRRQSYDKLPSNIIPSDWYMHLYHAQFGDIGYIDRVMSVYRRHNGGVWWKDDNNKIEFWQKNALSHMEFYARTHDLFSSNETHKKIIRDSVNNFIDVIMTDCADSDRLVQRNIAAGYPRNIVDYVYKLIDDKTNLDNVIQHLNSDVKAVNKRLLGEEKRHRITQEKLADIENSKGWKMLCKLHTIKYKLKNNK